METEQLVVLAQSGNAAAMDRLLEDLRPRLVRWAHGLYRSPDTVQDVVQDAMAKVVDNLVQLAHPAAFVGWAYTILRRCGIEFFRRQSRSLPDNVGLDDATADPALVVLPAPVDASIDVERCLTKLKPEDQALLSLYYWHGFELTEIAPMLGIATGAAKVRLFRARGKVRDLLTDR